MGSKEQGTCKNYQENKGAWQKLKGNEETTGLSREYFHVQILKYFCILACRGLNSAHGLHDSIKLGWSINYFFSMQRLLVNTISSCIAIRRFPTL